MSDVGLIDDTERMYHLKVRSSSPSDKWEERSTYERVTAHAMMHAQALTMRSKFRPEVQARTLLVGEKHVPTHQLHCLFGQLAWEL
jgi:hypothetical protein